VILDANLLLYATDDQAPQQRRARASLTGRLGGDAITGNLVPDAHLAALAIEHGVAVASTDTDFARFTEVRWVNPLAG
jgi:predicted nucleic acid-binding protein